jgi:hypothetical protein
LNDALAVRTGLGQSAESIPVGRAGGVHQSARGSIELSHRVHRAPLRMVEQIKRLNTQLEVPRGFFAERKLLKQRYIPYMQSRSPHRIDSRIHSGTSLRRWLHTGHIDVSKDVAFAVGQIRVAGEHDSRRHIFAARNPSITFRVPGVRQRVVESQRRADAYACQSGQLPSVEDLLAKTCVEPRSRLRQAGNVVIREDMLPLLSSFVDRSAQCTAGRAEEKLSTLSLNWFTPNSLFY